MTAAPTLVVVRGNSGSGKTTAARAVRDRYGRGCALIEQDHLRRIVLREHDLPGLDGAAPAVVAATAGAALAHGYHVVVEGMLIADRYRDALRQLIAAHPGPSAVFYLQVSLAETIRRHATRTMPGGVLTERHRRIADLHTVVRARRRTGRRSC